MGKSTAVAFSKQSALVFDSKAFLAKIGTGKTTRDYRNKQVIFSRGMPPTPCSSSTAARSS